MISRRDRGSQEPALPGPTAHAEKGAAQRVILRTCGAEKAQKPRRGICMLENPLHMFWPHSRRRHYLTFSIVAVLVGCSGPRTSFGWPDFNCVSDAAPRLHGRAGQRRNGAGATRLRQGRYRRPRLCWSLTATWRTAFNYSSACMAISITRHRTHLRLGLQPT